MIRNLRPTKPRYAKRIQELQYKSQLLRRFVTEDEAGENVFLLLLLGLVCALNGFAIMGGNSSCGMEKKAKAS